MTNNRVAQMDRPMNCIATFVAEDEEVTRVEMFTRGAHEERERYCGMSFKTICIHFLDTKRE